MKKPISKTPNPHRSYYSFWLGERDAPRSKWVLSDVKIPAQSPLHALYMYAYLHQWKPRKQKAPTLSDVWIGQVQRIVEYEKRSEKGCTVVVFRQVKVWRNPLENALKSPKIR